MPYSDYIRSGAILKQAHPLMSGQDLEEGNFGKDSAYNGVGAARNVWANTVTSTTANQTFEHVVRDSVTNAIVATVTGTTGASSTTAALVAADVLAAWEANADASAAMSISLSTATLTATARAAGVSYTVSSATTGHTSWSESTASGEPSNIRPGRCLFRSGSVHGQANVGMAAKGQFTAQVQTHTVAGASGDSYTPIVYINGQKYVGDAVEFNTDADTTATDLATEINAIMPAETVIATTSTADLILTAEVEGAEFDAVIVTAVSGEVVKVNTTGPSAATSLRRADPAIALYEPGLSEGTLDTGDGGYRAFGSVPRRFRGRCAAYVSGSPTVGDAVYVGVGSGDEGNLYAALSTDRIYLGSLRVAGAPDDTTDGVYILEIGHDLGTL